jgi:CNT family concentrative nucleoside transporter
MDRYNLVSFGGLIALMVIAWALSAHRRRLNVRAVCWGVAIQLALAAVVFCAPGSRGFFERLNDGVVRLLSAAQAGQRFLFGSLADEPTLESVFGEGEGFVLALQALPVIIFFAALMGLLYYWRIMPLIVRAFAWLFTRLMRISGAESLCAASNIFVGIESATAVRPYLGRMTRSEFCTVLTAGMATVASSTLGVYVLFLKDTFPTIAGHLISASILSAPAAIVMSKLLLPETQQPETLGARVRPYVEREEGAIVSIINGAMAGVKMVVGIVALLIAFLGIIALIDLALEGIGGWFGRADLSIGMILGYVFRPLAVLIGVPPADAATAGDMLGIRLVKTEIPAYLALKECLAGGEFSHPRSAVVIAYALCGFAHVASMAVFTGGIGALVPERRKDLASVGARALLAATLACLMTGAVAGVFYHTPQTVIEAAAQPPATLPSP